MSNNKERKLLPNLRFAEFDKNDGWDLMQIGGVLSVESSTLALNKLELKKDGYAVYGADGIIGYIDSYQNKEPYISIVKDGSGVGRLNLCNGETSTLGTLSVLKSKDERRYKLAWAYYLLNTVDFSSHVKGSGIPHIYFSDYQCENVGVPEPEEQQKIASCLSFLDEIITAEIRKLEILKEHQKGLLQNLFPQKGQTLPKLRFKEFDGSEVWEEITLGDIGEPLMCKRIFKEETTPNPTNGIPFYKIGTFGRLADSYITEEVYKDYKSKYSFPNIGDILISASGTIGRLVVYDGLPAYFQDSNIIWLGHSEQKILNKFLFYCYLNLKWQTSDGGVISRLYNSDFKRMKIHFPNNQKEQEKIADTLASIDNFINTQNQKVETLILHKKGLLQGLFPDVKDINA